MVSDTGEQGTEERVTAVTAGEVETGREVMDDGMNLLITIMIGAGVMLLMVTYILPIIIPPLEENPFEVYNERCDLCLKQFSPQFNCTHNSTSKICEALASEMCLNNCTIILQNSVRI